MAFQRLVVDLNVVLNPGASVTLQHGLTIENNPQVPNYVVPNLTTAIRVVAVDDQNIKFQNFGALPDAALFHVEHRHTTIQGDDPPILWQGLGPNASPLPPFVPGDAIWGSGDDGLVTIAADTDQTKAIYATDLVVNAGKVLRSNGQVVAAKNSIVVNGNINAVGANGGPGASAGSVPVDFKQGFGAAPGVPGPIPLSDGYRVGTGGAGAFGQYGFSAAVNRIFDGESVLDPHLHARGGAGGNGGICDAIPGGLGGTVSPIKCYAVSLLDPSVPALGKSSFEVVQEKPPWMLNRDLSTDNVALVQREYITTRGNTFLEIDAVFDGEQSLAGANKLTIEVDNVEVWHSGNDVFTSSASHDVGETLWISVAAGAHHVDWKITLVSPGGATLVCNALTNAEHAASGRVREVMPNPVISSGGAGGGGGSGGAGAIGPAGGAGGSPGGAIVLAAPQVTIAITGVLDAAGGNGGNGGTAADAPTNPCGGGGAGGGAGGGFVQIFAESLTVNGVILVPGGVGGSGGPGLGAGAAGAPGLPGENGQVMWIKPSTGQVTIL